MSNKEKEELEENIDDINDAIEDGDDISQNELLPLYEASQHVIMNMIRDLCKARECFINFNPYEALEILDSIKGEQQLLCKTADMMIEIMDTDISLEPEELDEELDEEETVPEEINPEKELDS